MEYFGIAAFVMVICLYSKVHRLERILRENGISAKGAAGLGDQLRKQVGQTVELTLEANDGDISIDLNVYVCKACLCGKIKVYIKYDKDTDKLKITRVKFNKARYEE